VRSKADQMARKKIIKNFKQKPSSSEETVRAIVREGRPGGRRETTGGRRCEQSGESVSINRRSDG